MRSVWEAEAAPSVARGLLSVLLHAHSVIANPWVPLVLNGKRSSTASTPRWNQSTSKQSLHTSPLNWRWVLILHCSAKPCPGTPYNAYLSEQCVCFPLFFNIDSLILFSIMQGIQLFDRSISTSNNQIAEWNASPIRANCVLPNRLIKSLLINLNSLKQLS